MMGRWLGVGGQVLGAADDVGDLHQVVVHDVGEIVGGHSVTLKQHLIVKGGVLDGDLTVDQVIPRCASFQRNPLTDDVRLTGSQLCLHFLSGQVAAVAVVAFHRPFLAETVVGRAFFHQLQRELLVHALALALDVGAVVASYVRTLVMIEPGCLQSLVDDIHGTFDIASLIGVLYPEYEFSVL